MIAWLIDLVNRLDCDFYHSGTPRWLKCRLYIVRLLWRLANRCDTALLVLNGHHRYYCWSFLYGVDQSKGPFVHTTMHGWILIRALQIGERRALFIYGLLCIAYVFQL